MLFHASACVSIRQACDQVTGSMSASSPYGSFLLCSVLWLHVCSSKNEPSGSSSCFLQISYDVLSQYRAVPSYPWVVLFRTLGRSFRGTNLASRKQPCSQNWSSQSTQVGLVLTDLESTKLSRVYASVSVFSLRVACHNVRLECHSLHWTEPYCLDKCR